MGYTEEVYYIELPIAVPAQVSLDGDSLQLVARHAGRHHDDRFCVVLQTNWMQMGKDDLLNGIGRIWGLVVAIDGQLLGVLIQQPNEFLVFLSQIQPSTGEFKWHRETDVIIQNEDRSPDLTIQEYLNFIIKHDVK